MPHPMLIGRGRQSVCILVLHLTQPPYEADAANQYSTNAWIHLGGLLPLVLAGCVPGKKPNRPDPDIRSRNPEHSAVPQWLPSPGALASPPRPSNVAHAQSYEVDQLTLR